MSILQPEDHPNLYGPGEETPAAKVGMKRYAISEWENEDGCMEQGGLEESPAWGEYCLYEEAHQVEVDRDIKAANLQLLVDKVLDYKEAVESAVGGPGHIDTYEAERLLDDTVALARSLKQ